MRWRKLGRVFGPEGDQWWAREYAHLPTPELVEDRLIRVYFAALDGDRHGRVGYVDLDAGDPTRIVGRSDEPIFDIGPPGQFDDSGVNPSCVFEREGRRLLSYIGWQRCRRVPYMLFSGVAEIGPDGKCRRLSRSPVLDRTDDEPFLRSATTIIKEAGPDRYRAWYVSALGWTSVDGTPYPRYVVRHAESRDGMTWSHGGPICIDHASDDEFGIGRPWVLKEDGRYRMWYSIRSRTSPYRIGYAESADGLGWIRKDDQAGIARSETGWDSEMICYPAVIDAGGRRLMFYNGNRHGASGFGVAVLEDEAS